MIYGYINLIKYCFNSSLWVAMKYNSFKSPTSACKFSLHIIGKVVDNLCEDKFSLVMIPFISTELRFQKHRYKENSMVIANGA